MMRARLASLCLAVLLAVGARATAAAEGVDIRVDSPSGAEVTRGVRGMGFVSGHVLGHAGDLDVTDVIALVDISYSTHAPSGSDIDGDGKARGRWIQNPILNVLTFPLQMLRLDNYDDTDTVLAAELSAVGTLLDHLDPRVTRVGLVTFSGDTRPDTLDATLEVALTHDYTEVRRALEGVRERGPEGRTNMLAGISLATLELIGADSVRSTRRPGARKVVLLFSDGRPTLPSDDRDESEAQTVKAARRAARSGIRIRGYAVGAEGESECLAEVVKVSQGTYTVVTDPGQLSAEIANVELRDVDEIRVENLASGAPAEYVTRSADGSFFALVPIQPGRNPIQVVARTTDGGVSAQKRIDVDFREDTDVESGAPSDPTLARARRELLERWLADVQKAEGAQAPETH